MRETSGLELEQEETEPTIERNFKTKFEIPNEYTDNILITGSDFIMSDRTNFDHRLEVDFKRENQKWNSCSDREQDWKAWRRSYPRFHKCRANTYFFGDEGQGQ